ncbi:sporulation protein [Paenibacillus sp. MZ04-78.2]|uniref:sporulation protein n=1 Tax=Paenibacillus sp. MZ04-78.2 TaxID=2962034 RepID=UPI0020B89BCF|nr:sporulation protein [Paenibacillus sp. MZ04-78.2]MCP3776131.1 sporulation protein [Paenibacillus sp. MZ04-78.2]
MSIFKKVLASVGIGSAKVDTKLEHTQVSPGETLSGVAHIQGGQLEQQIGSIYVYLKTEYLQEDDNGKKMTYTAEIAKYHITDGFLLRPGDSMEIPFALEIPEYAPLTHRNTPVWVETGLDIDRAIDPTDRDEIEIVAGPNVLTVMGALDELGFRLREVTNEYAPSFDGPAPFVQEFEYVPTTHFRRALDELEVLYFPRGDDLELFLQIDRRARGSRGRYEERMGLDESFVRVTIPGGELRRGSSVVCGQLQELISRYC